MEQNDKIAMYDRLYAISINFEADPVPNPTYLHGAIVKCHQYIEETERYHIQVTREMSIVQRALNNTQAEYQTKKDKLIDEMFASKTSGEFLPNIKDREARANQNLKEELHRIQEYENELSDLNSLLRITTLKMRNLNQANQDIRSQIKLLESQLKLNALPRTDQVMSNFVSELHKSTIGEDSFMDSASTTVEENVVDPSAALDVDSLLNTTPNPEPNNLSEPVASTQADLPEQVTVNAGLLEPVPDLDPETNGENPDEEATTLDEPWEATTEEEPSVSPNPVVDLDVIIGKLEPGGVTQPAPIPDTKSEIIPEKSAPAKEADSVTDMLLIGDPLPSPVESVKAPTPAPQGETAQKPKVEFNVEDLDTLLDSINKNGK